MTQSTMLHTFMYVGTNCLQSGKQFRDEFMKQHVKHRKRYDSRTQVRNHIIAQMNKVKGFKWPSSQKVKEIHIQQRLAFGMACEAHDEGKFELSKQNNKLARTAAKRPLSQLTDVEDDSENHAPVRRVRKPTAGQSSVAQSKQKKTSKPFARESVQVTDVEDDSEDHAPDAFASLQQASLLLLNPSSRRRSARGRAMLGMSWPTQTPSRWTASAKMRIPWTDRRTLPSRNPQKGFIQHPARSN
jgi:hypothetical protein